MLKTIHKYHALFYSSLGVWIVFFLLEIWGRFFTTDKVENLPQIILYFFPISAPGLFLWFVLANLLGTFLILKLQKTQSNKSKLLLLISNILLSIATFVVLIIFSIINL